MFTHKIEFGFGCELDKDYKRISSRELANMLKRVENATLQRFVGCTFVETRGAWVNPTGVVFSERGYTLIVYTDQAGTYLAPGVVCYLKEILRQEAIAVCITEVNACIL